MRISERKARYEGKLAAAHRMLWAAAAEADSLGDQGAVEDIHALLHHIQVLTEDSLKNKKRPTARLFDPLK